MQPLSLLSRAIPAAINSGILSTWAARFAFHATPVHDFGRRVYVRQDEYLYVIGDGPSGTLKVQTNDSGHSFWIERERLEMYADYRGEGRRI